MKATHRMLRVGAAVGLLALLAGAMPAAAGPAPGRPDVPYPTIFQQEAPTPGWQTELAAVAASPSGELWAVGYWRPYLSDATGAPQAIGGNRQPLVLRFNGKVWWQDTTLPDLGPDAVLTAVAAYAPDDIWVVGYSQEASAATPLVLHWNRGEWKILPNPLASGPRPIPAQSLRLTGVLGIKTNTPLVIGHIEVGLTVHPVALVYVGDSWNWWAFPDLPAGALVTSLSARMPNDIWALASVPVTTPQPASFARANTALLRFDGLSWKVVGYATGSLTALYAGDNEVITVGRQLDTLGSRTLAMRYIINIRKWATVDTPSPDKDHNFLTGVVRTGDEIFAVGYAGVPENQDEYTALVLRWDGLGFQALATPHPSRVDRLAGATVYQGHLWAVGASTVAQTSQPLILTTWSPFDHPAK